MKIGVMELLQDKRAESWAYRIYNAQISKQFFSITPQAIAGWCRKPTTRCITPLLPELKRFLKKILRFGRPPPWAGECGEYTQVKLATLAGWSSPELGFHKIQ